MPLTNALIIIMHACVYVRARARTRAYTYRNFKSNSNSENVCTASASLAEARAARERAVPRVRTRCARDAHAMPLHATAVCTCRLDSRRASAGLCRPAGSAGLTRARALQLTSTASTRRNNLKRSTGKLVERCATLTPARPEVRDASDCSRCCGSSGPPVNAAAPPSWRLLRHKRGPRCGACTAPVVLHGAHRTRRLLHVCG